MWVWKKVQPLVIKQTRSKKIQKRPLSYEYQEQNAHNKHFFGTNCNHLS